MGYKLSTGTVQFTLMNPLPDALVRELVWVRVGLLRRRRIGDEGLRVNGETSCAEVPESATWYYVVKLKRAHTI